MNNRMLEITRILPQKVRNELLLNGIDFEKLEEIRIRIGMPLIIFHDGLEKKIPACIISNEDINEAMELISNHSIYAYEEDIKNGFITVMGGHRIGICGKVVIVDGKVKTIKYISFINIRVSHQIRGCADEVYAFIHEDKNVVNTLIVSPPGCGKTTMLRDLVRQISNGNSYYDGMTVGVVDERSEIGACFNGRPQNDLGVRTDVLDCCPKAIGMIMMVRSMSPKVLAVDEISTNSDFEAIKYVLNCGCTIIATTHAKSYEELMKKKAFKQMLEEHNFKRIIILGKENGVGTIVDKRVCG